MDNTSRILNLISTKNKAMDAIEISDFLGIDLEEVCKILIELEENLKIRLTKKGKYTLSDYKIGKISITKSGNGFVIMENENDIYIDHSNLNGAINGDIVAVELLKKHIFHDDKREGQIIKVLEHDKDIQVGEVLLQNNKRYIKLDDPKKHILIEVNEEDDKGVMEGHKVVINIGHKLKDNIYNGEIVKVIGHKNDPGIDILSIAAKYEINDIFPDEVIDEVEKKPLVVSMDELNNRRDLRNEEIFTIDGLDAKDLDDAVSLKILENGNYLLGVHIADVSYYVTEDSFIDSEALERGTSVYLADRVIPMLPHKLSNGICSLNGGVDRLTMSCEMEIDSKGDVVNYDIFESVINSKKRMNYKDVNEIIENNNIPLGYETFQNTILKMKELADILRENKIRRGYIDFDLDEPEIVVDETGKATDIKLRERGAGEKLIEDFMIVANETVATHIFYMELPFIYRIHGEPDEEKIMEFVKFVKLLGYKLEHIPKQFRPKDMQIMLEELHDKKEFTILSNLLLRSMKKAIYDPENIGHFGLASKCYTHFTSPIRRYPDLIVHRTLRKYLFKNEINKETIDYLTKMLPIIAEHSSVKERAAIDCERDVNDMKMAEYMMDHIGEIFSGVVISTLPFGMFVRLPNGIEGLVKIETLPNGPYIYDEGTMTLRSDKNMRGYRIGDDVTVKAVSASKETSQIDFELVLDEAL